MDVQQALEHFENVPQDPPQAADAARRGARLPQARPAVADALRRRGPADQAGPRTGQEEHRQDALPARRADDRPALRRHRAAAQGAARLRRRGQHGARGRAQSGRDQDGRLGHRPRARRRRRRRARSSRRARRRRSAQCDGVVHRARRWRPLLGRATDRRTRNAQRKAKTGAKQPPTRQAGEHADAHHASGAPAAQPARTSTSRSRATR